MLSSERIKEILSDPSISDEEIEQIRYECRELAEIIFEHYQQEKQKGAEENPEEIETKEPLKKKDTVLCPKCGKRMMKKVDDTSSDFKNGKKYRRKVYWCKNDDSWINIEIPRP